MPKPWPYDFDANLYYLRWTPEMASNPVTILGLILFIRGWGLTPDKLLKRFSNMYRDYRGRLYCPEKGFIDLETGEFQEVFLKMKHLEDAPYMWWERQFGPYQPRVEVIRVKPEVIARWRVIGTICGATYPKLAATQFFDLANQSNPPA